MSRRDGTVRVEGDDRFRATLRRAADELGDLKATHREAAQVIVDRANPPVVSGALAGGLRVVATDDGAFVTVGGPAEVYAGPIHWGWPARHIKAQPFVVEAEQSAHDQWVNVYADRLDDIVSKIEGK